MTLKVEQMFKIENEIQRLTNRDMELIKTGINISDYIYGKISALIWCRENL